MKGIPYYPINEEGAVGVGVNANIPFGAWGGGFSSGVGVRLELFEYTSTKTSIFSRNG